MTGDGRYGTGLLRCRELTDLERTSDHCSDIAGCVIDMANYMANHNMNLHESLRSIRNDSEDFRQKFKAYAAKYSFMNAA